MARRLTRSSPTQVAPDAMMFRRREQRFALDAPLSAENQGYPLTGGNSVWNQVGPMTVEIPPRLRRDVPVLTWKRPLFGTDSKGNPKPRNGQTSTAILSITSKMSCPSFSLPAGPTTEEGTCPSANFAAGKGLRQEGRTFVCDNCYSLEGRYIVHEVQVAQSARARFVVERLAADPTGQLLADGLVAAIAGFARHTTLHGIFGGLKLRRTIELGVWSRGQVLVPSWDPTRKERVMVPAAATDLPQRFLGSSRDFLASGGPRDGEVAGFFRIHDSGDFGIGNPKMWASYVAAWVKVAQALPNVHFWAPTRLWPFPMMRKAFAAAERDAPNLAIRPSALHFDDAAPSVAGAVTQGSTVASPIPTPDGSAFSGRYVETTGTDGTASMLCPVYTYSFWDPELVPKDRARREAGESGDYREHKSCQAAGCRACWLRRDTPVAYGAH